MVKHQKRDCVRGWLDIVALWVTNPMSLLAVEIFLLSVGIEPPSQKAGYPKIGVLMTRPPTRRY